MYFPCDMSVKSNFTFDLIFLIHGDSEKSWFPLFLCPKSKMAMKMTDILESLPKTIPLSFVISRGFLRFSRGTKTWLKSVQSALSDLKLPPERLQSQCNYRPFIT